jgi:hypothetical protein
MTYRAAVADAHGLEPALNSLAEAGWTVVSVAGNGQSYLLGGAGPPKSYLIICHGEGELPHGVDPLFRSDDQAW